MGLFSIFLEFCRKLRRKTARLSRNFATEINPKSILWPTKQGKLKTMRLFSISQMGSEVCFDCRGEKTTAKRRSICDLAESVTFFLEEQHIIIVQHSMSNEV